MVVSAQMLGVVAFGCVLVAAGACEFPDVRLGISDSNSDMDASPAQDASLDVGVDAQVCFGTGLVRVCLEAPPTQALTISSATTLATSDPTMCARTTSGADSYCVLAATDISITAPLRALGPRPFVLIASGAITSNAAGVLDVGSHRGTGRAEAGAGANFSGCDLGAAPAVSGGGAGGSFLGKGGNGGSGAANGSVGGTSGARINTVTALRGGCPGQAGNGNSPGVNGLGGGAVFLIAGTSIAIGGRINAAGEGGVGGLDDLSGGGGGGSGGMIGFDAPTVTVTNLLLASGGGGGEGSRQQGTGNGGDGADPTTTAPAAGGDLVGDPLNGNGGAGSPAEVAGSGSNGGAGSISISNSTNRGAGGGGGGGAGIIIAPANADLGTNISPPRAP